MALRPKFSDRLPAVAKLNNYYIFHVLISCRYIMLSENKINKLSREHFALIWCQLELYNTSNLSSNSWVFKTCTVSKEQII